MQAIDNSGLRDLNANLSKPGFVPRQAYVWDPVAKTVTITDTTGRPANAAELNANIQVADDYGNAAYGHISTGGSGYNNVVPAVTFAGANTTPATATAILDPTGNRVIGFNITNPGAGYGAAPVVTIANATGPNPVQAKAIGVITNGTLTGLQLVPNSTAVIDVSGLSPNKGLSITSTIVVSVGWSATGSAINITNAASGGTLQDWNKSDSPASAR